MPLFTSVGTVSSYTRRAGGRFAGDGESYQLLVSMTADLAPSEWYLARNSMRGLYYTKDSDNGNIFTNSAGVIQQSGATHNIVFLGDSITQGGGSNTFSFAAQVIRRLRVDSGIVANYKIRGVPSQGLNYQGAGSDIPVLNTDAATTIDPARSGSLINRLVIMAGTNDIALNATTGSATYTLLTTNIDARIAAGWSASEIVIVPCLPRGAGTNASAINTYNSEIAGDAGARGYKKVTLPTQMDADGEQSNTTYFYDTIHPTNYGAYLLAGAVITAMAL